MFHRPLPKCRNYQITSLAGRLPTHPDTGSVLCTILSRRATSRRGTPVTSDRRMGSSDIWARDLKLLCITCPGNAKKRPIPDFPSSFPPSHVLKCGLALHLDAHQPPSPVTLPISRFSRFFVLDFISMFLNRNLRTNGSTRPERSQPAQSRPAAEREPEPGSPLSDNSSFYEGGKKMVMPLSNPWPPTPPQLSPSSSTPTLDDPSWSQEELITSASCVLCAGI